MRIRRASSQDEFERAIDDFITRGYKVKSRGSGNARLKEKDYGSTGGHIIVALLTIWWTFGIGNAIYAGIKYSGADEVVVKLEEDGEE